MDQIVDWMNNPLVIAGIGYAAAWVVAMFAYALPKPTDDSRIAYVILYRCIQFAGANLDLMKERKLPPAQSRSAV